MLVQHASVFAEAYPFDARWDVAPEAILCEKHSIPWVITGYYFS